MRELACPPQSAALRNEVPTGCGANRRAPQFVPSRSGKKKRDVTSLSCQGEGESSMLSVLPADWCGARRGGAVGSDGERCAGVRGSERGHRRGKTGGREEVPRSK